MCTWSHQFTKFYHELRLFKPTNDYQVPPASRNSTSATHANLAPHLPLPASYYWLAHLQGFNALVYANKSKLTPENTSAVNLGCAWKFPNLCGEVTLNSGMFLFSSFCEVTMLSHLQSIRGFWGCFWWWEGLYLFMRTFEYQWDWFYEKRKKQSTSTSTPSTTVWADTRVTQAFSLAIC